jgi:AsmA protein
LPPLRDVHLAAEMADAGGAIAVSGLTVLAGAADLGAFVPGLRLVSLQADAAQAEGPVRFVVNGALREAAFTAGGSLTRDGTSGATVRDFSLASPAADIKGEIAAGWGGRPSLRATLAAQRIDLDGLLAAMRPPQSSPGGSAPPPVAGAPASGPEKRVFSDRPIPFAALRAADADVRFSASTVRSGGQDYHDIATHLALANGRLSVDPIGGRLPAGRLDGRMSVDATGQDAAVAVALRGPGLQVAPLVALLRLPAGAQGAVDVDADLHGTGNSPHALAATADGHLGLAMVNGAIDNRLISGTLGQVLQHARLPDLTARPGSLPVRCLAVRLDAHGGVADVRALLLDTSLFYLEGSGSVNLGNETLALRLRPLARLAGTGVIVPLRVGGGFRSPKVEVDAAGAAGEAAGVAAQAARSPQLGIIIGALGIDRMMPGAGSDDCGRQLALARSGLPGPQPTAAPPAASAPALKEKAPKPADLLRQFLR